MFYDGFPSNLKDDVSKVIELIPPKTYSNVSVSVSKDKICYYQNGVELKFPYRMYYIDVSDNVVKNLNIQQKMILHCIYTRSCDGFVRQKHLQSLILMDYEDWAIPYIVKLCDEYVIEILETIYDVLKEKDTERIKKFCLENTQLFNKSYDRMISYWNEYYRDRFYNLNEYVGRRLFVECFGY